MKAQRWIFILSILVTLSLVSLLSTMINLPTLAAAPTELFFSEYIEGSSNNKALEIYNGMGSTIDLGAGSYDIQMCFNGNSSAGLTIALTGSVAAGDVYVVAHASAGPSAWHSALSTAWKCDR